MLLKWDPQRDKEGATTINIEQLFIFQWHATPKLKIKIKLLKHKTRFFIGAEHLSWKFSNNFLFYYTWSAAEELPHIRQSLVGKYMTGRHQRRLVFKEFGWQITVCLQRKRFRVWKWFIFVIFSFSCLSRAHSLNFWNCLLCIMCC